MKAEERHKLKTNELAESLSDIKSFFQQYGNILVVGVIVILMVFVGLSWWSRKQTEARLRRQGQLQALLLQSRQMRNMAVDRARQGDVDAAAMTGPFQAQALAQSFAELAQTADTDSISMSALIQQAEALRAELVFSEKPLTDAEKKDLCDRAAAIYQQLLDTYPDNPQAVGPARLGLALLAEEQEQWPQARDLYQQIIAQKTELLRGTVWPTFAQNRIDQLDDISEPIVFAPTLPPAQTAPPGMDDFLSAPAPVPADSGNTE